MSVVVGKKFIPYNAAPPEALATISSFDEYLGFARVGFKKVGRGVMLFVHSHFMRGSRMS